MKLIRLKLKNLDIPMEKFESKEKQKEITIENPAPEDARAIREVQYEAWKTTYPSEESGITEDDIEWYFRDFKKSFSEKALKETERELEELPEGQKVLVAKDGDEVVGYAWLMKGDEQNEVGAIYILPDYQGEGIGKKILKDAEEYFDTNKDTVLTVAEHNKNAIAFYEGLGFDDTGKRLSSGLTFPSGAEYKQIEMLRQHEAD